MGEVVRKYDLLKGLELYGQVFRIAQTKGHQITITRDYGEDQYERLVVELSVDGRGLIEQGLGARHLARWPHLNGRALAAKPDRCG